MHAGLEEDFSSTYFVEDCSVYATEVCGQEQLASADSADACVLHPEGFRAGMGGCPWPAVGAPLAAGVRSAITVFTDDICHNPFNPSQEHRPLHKSTGTLAEVRGNVKRPRDQGAQVQSAHFRAPICRDAAGHGAMHSAGLPSKRCRAAAGLSRPKNKTQEAHQLKEALAASLDISRGRPGH